jgi:hypothetical protein
MLSHVRREQHIADRMCRGDSKATESRDHPAQK